MDSRKQLLYHCRSPPRIGSENQNFQNVKIETKIKIKKKSLRINNFMAETDSNLFKKRVFQTGIKTKSIIL